MLVYDYVELKKELFEYIINGSLPNSSYKIQNIVKSYYKCFGQTVTEVYDIDSNSYQYFISSAHPV